MTPRAVAVMNGLVGDFTAGDGDEPEIAADCAAAMRMTPLTLRAVAVMKRAVR